MPLVNDVHSRLNPTRVQRIERPTTLEGIQRLVTSSANEGRALSLCGARHAMGGQAFGTDATLLDTGGLDRILAFDPSSGTARVEAGIRWPALIRGCLERQRGRPEAWGIAQKQTGADRLSLGGALSANVHGRGLSMKPLVADVESFVVVDAQGEARRCSRTENSDLFRLVIGGYGLFGVVYSVTLRLVPRRKIRRVVDVIHSDEVLDAFDGRISDGFLYGDFQFDIDPASDGFLHRGVFSCYHPVDDDTPMPVARRLTENDWRELLFLAHVDKSAAFRRYADYYRSTSGQLYWSDTHQLGVYLDDYHKELDRRLGSPQPATEVITEIYVPRKGFVAFLEAVREDFRRHGTELIYGTVRLIERDGETFLPWARQNWACIVFNLHTVHTPEGIRQSADAFRRLIDLALLQGGSFYLTYHRFATREQIEACHPSFRGFLREKRRRDPGKTFQSDWWHHHERMFRRESAA
ncbi:MAG: FAD-binding oxidoreductase [Planctomycetota bacterium]|nr:FAD-binding oxidoreductase [Planctomycetota bacterium]